MPAIEAVPAAAAEVTAAGVEVSTVGLASATFAARPPSAGRLTRWMPAQPAGTASPQRGRSQAHREALRPAVGDWLVEDAQPAVRVRRRQWGSAVRHGGETPSYR